VSRVRSRTGARRAAAELAAHRRRLLELAAEAEADPNDALLLWVDAPSSRMAVTGVTSHAGQDPKGPQTPQGLTCHADLPAPDSDLPSLAPSGTAATPPYLPSSPPTTEAGRWAGRSGGEGAAHRDGLARLVGAALSVPASRPASSRAAVIGVTSHADKDPKGPQTLSGASGLTADPAHNVSRSAEFAAPALRLDPSPTSGAAHSADLPAFPHLPSLALAAGTTTPPSSPGGEDGAPTTDLYSASPAAAPAPAASASLSSTDQQGRPGGFPAGVTTGGID
jgi:hypothetical protein